MRYHKGDIFNRGPFENPWIVIPTNLVVRKDGHAVMGAGLAKEAADMFPGLSLALGNHIKTRDSELYVRHPVICLPTKTHFKNPSDLNLIADGCTRLAQLSEAWYLVGHTNNVLVPRLGCGLGGLNWEREVRPVVDSILSDRRFVLISNE